MATITIALLCLKMLAMDYGIDNPTVYATAYNPQPGITHTVIYMTDTPNDVDASCTVSLDTVALQLDTHECVESAQ